MRSILRLCLGLLVVLSAVPASALAPIHVWSTSFAPSAVGNGLAIATDGAGNVFLGGDVVGTVDFGGGGLTSAGFPGELGSDIYIAKFNSAGVHQWSKLFGSANYDSCLGVAADGLGNVLMTGCFTDSLDFGDGMLFSAGSHDIFVAKLDALGALVWSRRFGGTGSDVGWAIAVDALGSVFVSGSFTGTVDFGGGNLTSAGAFGYSDIFVAKYDANGVYQWSKRFGGESADAGTSVAVDGSGNVLATGYFWGNVDFGGDVLNGFGRGAFLAKFNSAGAHVWSKGFSQSGSYAMGQDVDVDDLGNVLLAADLFGAVDFGGGALSGANDIVLAKYNSSGLHQWSKRFGSGDYDIPAGVGADAAGNVFLTGTILATVNFGGDDLVPTALVEMFVAKFDAAGAHQWSRLSGDTYAAYGQALAVDGSGNAVIAGQLNSATANFGGDDLAPGIYLAVLGSCTGNPLITSITDIGNDQGRRVKIRFDGSCYDTGGSPTPILNYEAYLRDDAPPAIVTSHDPANLSRRQLLDDGWTFAGDVPAHQMSTYGIDVTTIGDSTIAAGQYYSHFFIRAATAGPGTFFDSPIDSGYSVDNLAPAVPLNFAYSAGLLSWNESAAQDFDYFTVYGSSTSAFGSATLIDYTTATGLNVGASSYTYYFVTATDFSGNEGKPATINALTGIGGTPKSYVLSISSYPNPFNPNTTVRYTLPSKGRVSIEVFDVAGARVATLIEADVDAGSYTVEWGGLDDRGNSAGSGVYFARITTASGSRSYKMTLLK